jgi:hypothetical protein
LTGYALSLRERRLLVQGLTDSLTLFGMEIPGDMSDEEIDESAARQLELRELRDRFATAKQRKQFKEP